MAVDSNIDRLKLLLSDNDNDIFKIEVLICTEKENGQLFYLIESFFEQIKRKFPI